MMENEREVRIAERTGRSDGGGGYRFNFQGRRGEKGEEEEEQQPKQEESPVKVKLSPEAERLLEEAEDDSQGETVETAEPQKKPIPFEKNSYFGIKKKGNRVSDNGSSRRS